VELTSAFDTNMMTTSNLMTVDNGNWIEVIKSINSKVRILKATLRQQGLSTDIPYIHEWNELYSNIMDDFYENNNITYEIVFVVIVVIVIVINPFPTVAHLFIFIFCSCFLPPAHNICHFPRTNY
jgi:ABC-type lipoprotein release transport system permease subunit